MLGIYLSGTGNTKHCVENLLRQLDDAGQLVPMEAPEAGELLSRHDRILLGYPIQYSNLPVMVRDFIVCNAEQWKGKQVLCLVTMGLFSGDGAGCSARLLKRYGAEVLGGLHLKMPDSISDVKLLKRSPEKNRAIIQRADQKMDRWAEKIRKGEYPQEGLHFYDRLGGFLGQRAWFSSKTRDYSDRLKISGACIGCGLCSQLCPMENIQIKGKKAVPENRCTMCYRCVNACPTKAITLLGKNVILQYNCDTYL